MKKIILSLIFGLTGFAYAGGNAALASLPEMKLGLPEAAKAITPPVVMFRLKAKDAMAALRKGRLGSLAWMVDAKMGLTFSPAAFIEQSDVVIPKDRLSALMGETGKRIWGYEDGSGFPIELTPAEYYKRFVYDADYASFEPVYNERVGVSNTVDNILKVYPNAMVAEYYNPGNDPEHSGFAWSSLRLVFVEKDYDMYLVAIVHDAWSI